MDSTAASERKCKEPKGGDKLFDGLEKLDVSDFDTLAFALGTPQKAPSDDQFTELAGKAITAPTLGQMALLRKLHFEATTLTVASINEQVQSDCADPTGLIKRLPAAEKQSRLEAQSGRLAGLKIAGELEPSHPLLDATNAMVEAGIITSIPPSMCLKRDDEVQANIKPSASTLQIERSTLKVAQAPVVTLVDVGSEVKLQWALQRRGLQKVRNLRYPWVSVQDVVLNSLEPSTLPSQPLPELSHFYTSTKKAKCLAHVAMVLVGVSRLDTK